MSRSLTLLKEGQVINNRYRVVRNLGRGGMGEVYLVEDDLNPDGDSQRLALKTMKRERRHEALQYFRHEFKALSELRHPNLARVFDFGVIESEDLPFFTVEYVEGRDLTALATSLTLDQLYPLIVQVCRALEYIHSRGLIHHDVKPENILVAQSPEDSASEESDSEERVVKLIDFGLVGRVRHEEGGRVPGTVQYIAPEILRGAAVDRRSDLYSLGVVLYQIVTGQLPFDGRTQLEVVRGHMEVEAIPPIERNPEVPEQLDTLIRKLLAKEPADRISSANEVIAALNEFAGESWAVETKETRESYILSGRLVGRERELHDLAEIVQAATGVPLRSSEDSRMARDKSTTTTSFDLPSMSTEAARAVVGIVGEAGIGKSRLLQELRVEAQLNGLAVFRGRGGEGDVSYGAIVSILRQAIRLPEAEALITRHGAELQRLLPEIAEGRELPAPVKLPPDEERFRLIHTVAQFFVDLSRRRPFLCYVGDVHAADPASLEVVGYLARYLSTLSDPVTAPLASLDGAAGVAEGDEMRSRETDAEIDLARETSLDALEDPESRARMLLCTSWRPDEEPAEWTAAFGELEQSKHAQRLALKPLTLPDVRRLIVSMLGIAKDPGLLAKKLHEESGGNPYVIEEVMKALVEEGTLAQRDGEWTVQADTLAKLTLPGAAADVVARRLARLDDGSRTLLQQLAALGRPATLDLLARIADRPAHDLLPILAELVRRELLVRERPEGAVRYRIPHKPLRDAAYDTLPEADRPAVHARIAGTLENGREEVPDAEAEELAHHALLAADVARGPRYALQGGAHAAKVYANKRAVELYQGAAKLLPADDVRQGEIVEALAPLYTRTGEFTTAIAQYDQLLQRDGLTPTAIAAYHGAVSGIHRKQGDFAGALAAAARGKAVLPADEPTHEMVQLLIVEATVRVLQGDADGGRANANQALALADAVGDRESDAQLFVLLGHVGMVRGDVKEAIAQYRKALDAAERVNDTGGIATAYHSLGHAYTRAGDFQSALGYLKRSQAIKERIGDIYRIADTLNNLGVLFIEKGDFPTALEYQRRCLAIRDRIGDQYGRAQAFSNLGILHDEMGNSLEAMGAFEQSLEIRRAIGDQDGIAVSLGNLGVTAHDRGDFARALTSLRQAVELRDQAGRIDEQIQVRVNLGHLYLTLGDLDAAAKPLEEAQALAADSPLRQHQADVQEALGVLDWLRGKWSSAEKQLRGALESFKELSNTYGICEAEVAYAELAHECGQTDRALKLARDALKLAEENRSRKFRVRGLLILGKVEAELGHDSSAMDQLQEALRLAEASEFREWLRDAHHALGALHVALARFDTAETHLLRAQELGAELAEGLPDELKQVYLTDRRRKRVTDDLGRLRERMLDTRTEITLAHRSTFKRRITDLEVSHSRLLKILEINKALNSEHRVGPLLDLIMDGVIELTDAERGFLILREGIGEGAAPVPGDDGSRSVTDFGDGLQVVAARNINREAISGAEFRISHSIAEQAMRAGHPVIVTNAQEDERFREQQSVEDLNLRSVCCFPLKGKGGVLGAMYLDNRFRKGVFSEGDLRVLEAFGDQAALAIENARLHADIVTKAENIEQLNGKLSTRLEHTSAELAVAKEKLETTQRETELKYDYSNLVGRDGGLGAVCKVLDRVIPTLWPVVIQGEPGTGKELIAKAIHFNGPRKDQPFVAENCAAISESLLESELFGHVKGAFTGASSANRGLFQAADGGTLFLDEIGEMSLGMQAKLLRVLQESEVRPVGGEAVTKVDVRILAATNRDLKEMIADGSFREDLYYRIANMEVELPPLRDRREDIPALANHALTRAAAEMGVSAPELSRETMAALMDHAWPGNVRELENEMKRVITLADGPIATPDALSGRIRGAEIAKGVAKLERGEGSLKEAMAEVEKAILLKALEKNRWNKSATAKELGISRVGLHKKCAKYGIK